MKGTRDVNKMILLGRLGTEPVRRETKSGVAVAHFSMATSYRTASEADENGETSKEETQWHQIVVWGKLAENCASYLKKGEKAYVEGHVRSRKYEDKKGESRYMFEVHAERVLFLGSSKKRAEAQDADYSETRTMSPTMTA